MHLGSGESEHARAAMASVDKLLVDRDAGLVELLDPPFDKSALEPGYIKGYLPGVRENGGQYTHAAVWAAMAFALAGDIDKAWELFGMLNPISHADDPPACDVYKVEPYVVRRRHLRRAAARRPRRLDLVHRRRRLDVPAGRGDPAGHPLWRWTGCA